MANRKAAGRVVGTREILFTSSGAVEGLDGIIACICVSTPPVRVTRKLFLWDPMTGYCTISFNSAVTGHSRFPKTPPVIFSRFFRFLEICRRKLKNHVSAEMLPVTGPGFVVTMSQMTDLATAQTKNLRT